MGAGSTERRLRHRAALRAAILDAALEIVSEQGLGALSIRAIADRVQYSAATIYLHFESKEALLREVAQEGFRRMHDAVRSAVAACGAGADRIDVLRALARSYLEFALEHTAYFRVMFDLPPVASVMRPDRPNPCPGPSRGNGAATAYETCCRGLLQPVAPPPIEPACAESLNLPIAALATLHGLTSLYLSGRLDDVAATPDQLLALAEACLAPYLAA